MANLYYNYDEPGLSPKKSGRARGVIIFIVVLLLTVGIVYLIVPKDSGDGGKTGDPDSKGNGGTPTEATTENPAEVTPAPIPETPPVAEVEKELPVVPETTETTTEATENPVKGMPWKNDPAPETDVPEKPVAEDTLKAENDLTQKNWRAVGVHSSNWCISHTVVRGDTLERIARKYHTTVNAIKEFNKLKSNTVYLGSKLTIVPGPWKIEVAKSSRRLRLINTAKAEERTFGVFDVGIGRQGRTPTADFVISIRLRNPDYIAPDGGVYAYNTPGNPLGDYFLKLAQPETADRPLAGYGIHGTADDSDVGKSISHGCIRMRNAEVKELYLLCPVGTPVHIAE